MKKILLILFLLVNFGGWGQVCGIPKISPKFTESFIKSLNKNVKLNVYARNTSNNEINWVAIKPWIIQRNGQNATTTSIINDYLLNLNQQFLKANIQFYILEISKIIDDTNNGKYWEISYTDVNNNLLGEITPYNSINAINIYFVNSIYTLNQSNQKEFGTLGVTPHSVNLFQELNTTELIINGKSIFDNQLYNSIYIAESAITYGLTTLTHEMGHYFGLFHTFENNIYKSERDDPLKGDYISDTNIDMTNSFLQNETESITFKISQLVKNCDYSEVFINKRNDNGSLEAGIWINSRLGYKVYDHETGTSNEDFSLTKFNIPNIGNLMGYFQDLNGQFCNSGDFGFTPKQIGRIKDFYPYRVSPLVLSYNISGYNLNTTPPQNLKVTKNENHNKLTWIDISQNETGFIIERAINIDDNFISIGVVLPNITTFIDYNIDQNVTYYYRVRASNSTIYNCNSSSATPYTSGERTVDATYWYAQDVRKATRLGLMDKYNWGNFSGSDNSNITVGEAAKSLIITANLLNVSGFASITPICWDNDPYNAYVAHLKSQGFLPSNVQSTDILKTGQLSDLIKNILFDKDINNPYPYQVNRADIATVIASNAPFKSSIEYLYKSIGYRKAINGKKIGDFFMNGKYDNTINFRKITGLENVTRAVFAKFITSAYEFKYYQLHQEIVPNARVAASTQTNSIFDDIIILGSKAEFDNDISGIPPTISVTGATEFLRSGESKNFSFSNDQLSDGTKVFFYWNIDGASQGLQLTPMQQYVANNQGVTLIAPTVTSSQTYQFYIHISTIDGRTAEMFKDIVVSPNNIGGNVNLSTGEYFFDTDPGFSLATSLPITLNNYGVDATIPIPTTNLLQGIHTFNIRVKDTQNNWSLTHTKPFLVLGIGVSNGQNSIVKTEYFFDNDPGEANRIQQNITLDANNQVIIPLSINLLQGIHTISFRVKDTNGVWSLFHTKTFLVLGAGSGTNTISSVEYFIDTDPGFGNGTQTPYSASGNDPMILNLALGNLSQGVHVLYVRVKNSLNQWSLTHARAFVIMPNLGNTTISRIEYFFDDLDTGQGNATPATFVSNPNADDVLATFDLSIAQLSLGIHKINVRAKDSNNQWSSLRTSTFEIVQIPCPQNQTVSETLTNGQRLNQAQQILDVQNTNYSGTLKADLKAGSSVIISPNTKFDTGTVIKIYIGGCSNN